MSCSRTPKTPSSKPTPLVTFLFGDRKVTPLVNIRRRSNPTRCQSNTIPIRSFDSAYAPLRMTDGNHAESIHTLMITL